MGDNAFRSETWFNCYGLLRIAPIPGPVPAWLHNKAIVHESILTLISANGHRKCVKKLGETSRVFV